MVRTVTVKVVDDFDGSPAQETVRFELDGAAYEIDLSAEHIATLRQALAPFVAAAREIGSARPVPRRPIEATRRRHPEPANAEPANAEPANADQALVQEMREWARSNGFPVAERGRISAEVQAAFRATPPEVRAEQAATFAEIAAGANAAAVLPAATVAPAAVFSGSL